MSTDHTSVESPETSVSSVSRVAVASGAVLSGEAGLICRTRVRLAGRDWDLSFDRTYSELLLEGGAAEPSGAFLKQIEPLVAARGKGLFRYPVTFRTVPLMIQVDPRRSVIGVFSWRAASELFLEDALEDRDYEDHVRGLKEADAKDAPVDLDIISRRHGLKDFNTEEFQDVYERTLVNERELLALIHEYRPNLMERVSDFSLNLTAQYVLVRNHLLKFLAILPSLDHDRRGREVKRILLEAIRRLLAENRMLKARATSSAGVAPLGDQRPLPRRYMIPVRLANVAVRLIPAAVSAWFIRAAVRFMAKRFIAGESIRSATGSLTELRSTGREATIDQLGELVVSEKEADAYKNKVLELMDGFARYVPVGERNAAGIHSAHVSIKVTALASQFVPESFDFTYGLVAPRLREILIAAKERNVFVNVDAEHYHVRDLVFEIYRKVLLETPELRDFDGTGIVVQAYLRDAADHLNDVIALAKQRGLTMPVRLVKGAYWDAETIEAEVHSYKAPQFLNKEETDIYYRQLVYRIFENHPHLRLCLASHNLFDHAFAEALRAEKFPHLPPFEHQCLHMTYEGLSTALARWGVPTRNYVPVGSLLVGMAYLVRRIMENSSQVGFLTQMRNAHIEKALIPSQILKRKRVEGRLAQDWSRVPSAEFENLTPVRLYKREEREAFFGALELFRSSSAGGEYANSFELGGDWQEVRSPSQPEILVGRIRFGAPSDVEKAIRTASGALSAWGARKAPQRAAILVRAAQLMTVRRLELASLIVMEAGKGLREALADVDEAVDFLQLYAREEHAFNERVTDLKPRGVTAVISPWNFPLAIPCGMVSAPLVAGNTVILKSAEQSPLIAQCLVDLMHDAGVPRDALIHLPGFGEDVGAGLVQDERVEALVFTGSKGVGTWIARTAGRRVKDGMPARVITEMGGKNAIIVTSSAELDETVAGTLYSAFAHAGQKCSALSRVLVDASVKDSFVERFAEAARDLRVGESWDPASYVNPVISKLDQERLRRTAAEAIEEAKRQGGRVLVDRSNEKLPGFGVGPVVIELPTRCMELEESYCRKEHFGPIVHVIPYKDLDEAVRLFNSVEYGLTGGIFSQSQDDIDYLLARVQSGNVYVNRSCTGARVAIEPFGGFKLSGTGPKAGQKHYIPVFHRFDRKAEPGGTISFGHREEIPAGYAFSLPLKALSSESEADALALVREEAGHHLRALWNDYLSWSIRNLAGWIANGEPNRRIKGQLSYDDYRLVRPRGLLVAGQTEVGYSSWVSLVSGALLGMEFGVLLESPVSDDPSARSRWESMVSKLRTMGLNVRLVGREDDSFVSRTDTFVLDFGAPGEADVDGRMRPWLERIYDSPDYGTGAHPWMPQILTPADGPHVWDYPSLFRRFVMVRSFAINTMRHGAPLE